MAGCTLRSSETLPTLSLLRLAPVSESYYCSVSATAEDDGGNSKARLWCVLLTEPPGAPNSIGLKPTASANGKCGSNASWTKDYAYPSKAQATICDLYSNR